LVSKSKALGVAFKADTIQKSAEFDTVFGDLYGFGEQEGAAAYDAQEEEE